MSISANPTQARVPRGTPTGGQFATSGRSEADVSLTMLSQTTNETPDLGADRTKISIAQARRELPVGSRVQVVYPNRAVDRDANADIRTVLKQTDYEMRTRKEDGAEPTNSWGKTTVERDNAGALIVRDEDGTPYVAYIPLADGEAPRAFGAQGPVFDAALVERAREARATTDPAVLDQIADSELPIDRRAVAENACTTDETLDRLAADVDTEVRRRVASNKNAHPNTLDQLADDRDMAPNPGETKVRWFVASNPNTSTETLDRLANDPDQNVRAAVGRHPNASARTLRRLGTTPPEGRQWVNNDVVIAVASNPGTPPDLLTSWANGHGFVQQSLASNPSTPREVLERFATTDTGHGNQLRAITAANPAIGRDALHRLVNDDDKWVRQHAAENPSLTPGDCFRLVGDGDERVRRSLANNKAIDDDTARRLAADPSAFVRRRLAANTNLNPAFTQQLAQDSDHAVRAAVAANRYTASGILRELAKETGPDGEPNQVARQAQSTLAFQER